MKITSLVDNVTKSELKSKHGLSFYIETNTHKILFDLGSDDTLFENAAKRKIDISKVDIVIISHGHNDHGGALRKFLDVNNTAKIYVQSNAFESHYSKILFLKIKVGIDKSLKAHKQIKFLNGDFKIDEELSLFTVNETAKLYSSVNDALYDKNGRDAFTHEQNLVISENKVALIMGCGHTGIVNIMDKANKYQTTLCVGGFHLYNPITRKSVKNGLLDDISVEIQKYEHTTQFYTCHCTGDKAYQYISKQVNNLKYFACGDFIEV
ncbi:MAG: MBL fold metallo-hydrolase [Suipraeoptans sp.]